MWRQNFGKNDVESGPSQPLYPMMLESPELRWSFIRKIYSIVAIQLLFTVFVGAVVVSVRSISTFFTTTGAGLFLYILLIITPFVVLCPLSYYYQRHPVNYILLSVFTFALGAAIGLTCAYTSGGRGNSNSLYMVVICELKIHKSLQIIYLDSFKHDIRAKHHLDDFVLDLGWSFFWCFSCCKAAVLLHLLFSIRNLVKLMVVLRKKKCKATVRIDREHRTFTGTSQLRGLYNKYIHNIGW